MHVTEKEVIDVFKLLLCDVIRRSDVRFFDLNVIYWVAFWRLCCRNFAVFDWISTICVICDVKPWSVCRKINYQRTMLFMTYMPSVGVHYFTINRSRLRKNAQMLLKIEHAQPITRVGLQGACLGHVNYLGSALVSEFFTKPTKTLEARSEIFRRRHSLLSFGPCDRLNIGINQCCHRKISISIY